MDAVTIIDETIRILNEKVTKLENDFNDHEYWLKEKDAKIAELEEENRISKSSLEYAISDNSTGTELLKKANAQISRLKTLIPKTVFNCCVMKCVDCGATHEIHDKNECIKNLKKQITKNEKSERQIASIMIGKNYKWELTKEQKQTLLSSADWLEDFDIREMTKAKILSRIAIIQQTETQERSND